MDIKCPHCGAEYEVEKKDMYHYTTCEVCGKGFVIGATTSLLSSDESAAPASRQAASRMSVAPASSRASVPRSRPFAGKIGNGASRPSAPSSKFNWRNPFVWISIAGMCLISMLIVMVVVLYTSSHAKDAKMKAMLSTSYDGPKHVATQKSMEFTETEASTTVTEAPLEDVETVQIREPIVKDDDYISKLIKDANAGDPLSAVSQNELGDCYSEGKKGAEINHKEAVKWYRKAAEQGFALAQENLGIKYANGRGVEKNDNEAVKWYRKAAEQGRASAQYLLGCCYDQGKGVVKSADEAAKLYRKAAEQGFSYAQYCLGVCYEIGEGVEKDETEAVKWYSRAATQGHADAQYSLGECYYDGNGVDEDLDWAVKWYRKAAEQGHADAQYKLAKCYYEGDWVGYDPQQTVIWLRKAAAQGNAEAQKDLKDAIERQNKYKSDAELVKAFEEFRQNDESGMSLDGIIEKFLLNEGGWDERHCRDVIRNSLRKGRQLKDMLEDERKEYMNGSEFTNSSSELGSSIAANMVDSSDYEKMDVAAKEEDVSKKISCQDTEIARRKAATANSTLNSFCGINFGMSSVERGSSMSVAIDGEKYMMNIRNVKCNQFRSFGKRGYARVYKSSAGRVFLIHLKNEGNEPICLEKDGVLSKEASRVVSVLSSKYGKPYILEEGSRYNISAKRIYGGRLRVYLFPLGYSSIYLYLGYGSDSGLYCMNDIEAKRAIDDLCHTKESNAVEGYREFVAGDFLGLKFGAPSPYYRKGRNSFGMPKGTVNGSPEYSVHTGLGINFECRKMTLMEVGVTYTSHKVAMISARFDPLESIDEEFESLCAMCEKKMGARRQIDAGRHFATITKGNIVVTIKKGPAILFRAESKEMLRMGIEEENLAQKRDDAARELSLPGVESLDGPLRPRRK